MKHFLNILHGMFHLKQATLYIIQKLKFIYFYGFNFNLNRYYNVAIYFPPHHFNDITKSFLTTKQNTEVILILKINNANKIKL